MLTHGESMTAAILSRLYADALSGKFGSEPISQETYSIMILDYTKQMATPRKVKVAINRAESTITLEDCGAMGPAVPVDAECFGRTEAAFVDIEDHLMALGVTVRIA